MALTSSTGTISWFFMPISTATSTRHASFSMYRSTLTSNFMAAAGRQRGAGGGGGEGDGGGGGGVFLCGSEK